MSEKLVRKPKVSIDTVPFRTVDKAPPVAARSKAASTHGRNPSQMLQAIRCLEPGQAILIPWESQELTRAELVRQMSARVGSWRKRSSKNLIGYCSDEGYVIAVEE